MGLYIKRAFILVILLQIGLQTRADFYYFLHHKDKIAYRINSTTWNLEKLQSVGNWVVLNRIKLDSATRTSLPINIEINQISSEDTNQVYFSANCTNQFYRLDLKSMIFNRMDKTFYRGDNCHAYHFFRKGVLHSVGGYGFWRTNNHIIYFDEKSKEWEAYSSTGTPPQGIYGGFVAYLPEKDELISFMNYSHDVNLNNGAFFRDKAIYTYSFKSNKWSQKGSVYSKFFLELFDKTNLDPHNGNYFTGKYFIMPAIPFSGFQEYYAINARTLEMFNFKDNSNRLTKFSIYPHENNVNEVLRNKELVLNIRPNQSEKVVYVDGQLENIDALFLNSKSVGFINEEIWYQSEMFKWYLCLVLISLIVWWVLKKGKSLFFKRFKYANELKFSGSLVNETTIVLLKRLVETYATGGIDVDETNSILGLTTLGHDAQRYKRSAIVKEANVKLALLTNCHDTIQRQDSDLDRRQKRYMINSLAINAVKDFLKP
jgi:hypothetical protein